MHVLMISKALVAGAYHKKISEMVKLGIEIDLIIPSSWGSQRPEIISSSEYNIHTLPIFLSGKNHFHFYPGLSHLINSISHDILHIDEEPYSLITYQAMRIAKRKNIPSLFSTWQNIYKNYPFPFSVFERFIYNNAQVAIAGNQEAKEVLQKKGFRKEVFIVPQFGVDPEVFTKKDEHKTKEKLFGSSEFEVVGYIGRLVEEKGLLTLIEAFAKLNQSSRLLIVGDGPFKNKIIESSNRLKITERVVILDSVPSGQVMIYMNCLDCLVLPSLTRPNWKEQFGRVLIEAMACEVPVIGSDSGEIPIVIGDAGLIFKEGDVEDIRNKLAMLLSDRKLKDDCGKKGLARVLKRFTQKHVAEETFKVYNRILKK